MVESRQVGINRVVVGSSPTSGASSPLCSSPIFWKIPPAACKLELLDSFAYPSYMLIVHIQVHVKPELVESFKKATLANAQASLKEPGVVRFDIVQQQEDPARFVFVEVYRDAAAAVAHKETPHYLAWRDAVAPMMAEPRLGVKFNNVFPEDEAW
jgi:(4S)-4-hydroxy-5-phosphonooxypentane-2,3-dione isomerase